MATIRKKTLITRKAFLRAAVLAVRTADLADLRLLVAAAERDGARCSLLGRSSVVMGNLASALHWSVRRLDDVDNVLRAFFDAGASPNLENSDGCTLLEYALFVGASHASTVTLLLERGADVLRMTRFGTPFLVKAAATQPEAVINAMLKAGAPVNATELAPTVATGATALHVAASYARPEIVEMLLAAGADPCARTSEGTPLGLLLACMASAPESFAAERRRRCVELLEKAIAAA